MVKKEFVRLVEDYSYEDSLYSEENCFLSSGTEGVIINDRTINLIPNLSKEKHSEIVDTFLRSLRRGTYLVLLAGRIIEIPWEKIEHVRWEPPGPIFEDAEDMKEWLMNLFEN